jgi:long-subunit fatty acid transport protein
MGGAYTGVANDYSALYWNPAGLSQLEFGEFSFGLSYLHHGDGSTFLSNAQSLSSNALKLNSLGIAYPVPVKRGSLVVAFGYNRQSDFTTGMSFKGFNQAGSIIQSWAPNGGPVPRDNMNRVDPTGNLAWKLFLADTIAGRWASPIGGRLTQLAKTTEEGGLSNWSAGGAIDVVKDLSLGVTLTYVSGTYKYTRNYKEQDNNGAYTNYPYDFDQLVVNDDVESDLSGVNAKIGLMYRKPDHFRFGVTIKTPTSFRVKETFNTTAQSFFDSPDSMGVSSYGPIDSPGSDEYDVVTPWVFGAGASVIIRDLVLSGDVEYTDWTQMEFKNANQDLINKNRDIKDLLRATANLRAGAEYEIRDAGLRVRGGFIYNPSPYQGDPSSYDQKYVTAGLGVLLGESTMLDIGYARGWWNTRRINYDGSPVVDEKVTTNTFLATISVRF